MAMERFFNEFLPNQDKQVQEAFAKLIMFFQESDKDINLKTEIVNVPSHATLDLMAIWCKDVGAIDGSKYIAKWSLMLKEMNVSKDRESRKEYKEIMSAMANSISRQQEKTLTDKAMGK